MKKEGIEKLKMKSPCHYCGEMVECDVNFNWDNQDIEIGQSTICSKCGKNNIIQFDKDGWNKASEEERLSFIKTLFEVANQIVI